MNFSKPFVFLKQELFCRAVDFDSIKTKDYYVGSVVVSPCSAPTSCISGDILA